MKKIFQSIARNKGVTMLEMLLVLAIIAVLLVLATRYYASTSYSQKLSQLQTQVDSIKAATANWKLGNPTLKDLSIQKLYEAGYLPKADLDSLGKKALTPWGEEITVKQATTTPPYKGEISFTGATKDSKSACVSLKDTITANTSDTETNPVTCDSNVFKYTFLP